MTAVPASIPSTPQTFGELLRGFPAFLRKSIPTVVSSAVTAGVVGYVFNIWMMAVKYEGTNGLPKGTPVTTGDNVLGGAMFWALFSAVVFGIGSYAKTVGLKKFFAEMRTLPRVLVGIVRHDGAAGRIHLLWGACAALLAGLVLPPATGAVLAVGFLAMAPTVLGGIVSSFFGRMFSGLLKPIAPGRARPVGIEAMMVGLIGSSLALGANFVIPEPNIRLVLAIVCGGLAILLSQQLRPPTAVTGVLMLVGVVGAYVLVAAARAKADDGGFAECGNDIARWLSECGGADKIRKDGIVAAVTAALGAPPGAFVGKVIGEVEKQLGGGHGVFPQQDPPPDGEPTPGSGSPPGELVSTSIGTVEATQTAPPVAKPFPTGPELDARIRDLNSYNPNATPEEHMKAIDDFLDHLRENGGRFTPDDLRRLEELEGKDRTVEKDRHDKNTATLTQHGNEALAESLGRLQRDAQKERDALDALDKLNKATDFARNHEDDLPAGQAKAVDRVVTSIEETLGKLRRGEPVTDAERKLMEDQIAGINRAIFNSNTGRSEAEGAQADHDVATIDDWETRYRRAQIAAGVAASLAGIGIALAGAAGGAAATTVFGSTFSSSTIGGTMWGLGAAQGTITGGRQGESFGGHEVGPGMGGAAIGAIRNTLPVNVLSDILDGVVGKGGNAPIKLGDFVPTGWEDIKGRMWGAGGILVSTVQDIGNVGGIGDIADGMRGARPNVGGASGIKDPSDVLPNKPGTGSGTGDPSGPLPPKQPAGEQAAIGTQGDVGTPAREPKGPAVSDERIAKAVADRDAQTAKTGSGSDQGPVKPKTYTGTDVPVPGAKDANVATTMDALGADGRGKVFGPDGKQVAEVLPDGKIRPTVTEVGPDGKVRLASNDPINPDTVKFGPDGKIQSYELKDGRRVDLNGPGGETTIRGKAPDGTETVANAQGTRGRPGSLDPEVQKKWDNVRAGPDGEIYGADGRVIGKIDDTGKMMDANGREILELGPHKGGRVDEFTVNQPKGTGAAEPVTMKTRQPDTGPAPTREIEFTDAAGNTQKGTVPLTDDMATRGLRPGEEIPLNNIHELGASKHQIDEMGRVARDGYVDANGVRHPVEIEARVTNPESLQHIRDGTATPKPYDVKTKTINPVDTMIGARPEDVGKVGFFEPRKPPDFDSMSPKMQQQVEARIAQRNAELAEHGPHILELEQKGFLTRSADGTLVAGPEYPNKSAVGKPFAGDIDMVSIRDAKTGQLLTGKAYDDVVNNAKASGMQAQHGAEMGIRQDLANDPHWPGPKIDKLVNTLAGGHQTGAEVTYRVGPSGVPVRGERINTL